MNRSDRPASRAARRAQTDEWAAFCAGSCMDVGQDQRAPARHVANPVAVATLECAFAHMLRQGTEPQVLQITEAEAAAFPHVKQPHWPGWGWYLAVGVDRTGRAAYVLHPARVEGASPMKARRMIEAAMLAERWPLLEDNSAIPFAGGLA